MGLHFLRNFIDGNPPVRLVRNVNFQHCAAARDHGSRQTEVCLTYEGNRHGTKLPVGYRKRVALACIKPHDNAIGSTGQTSILASTKRCCGYEKNG